MFNIKVFIFCWLLLYGDLYKISSPILWEGTSKPVIRGIEKGIYVSIYQTPCDYFLSNLKDESKNNRPHTEDYKNNAIKAYKKCNEDFKKTFLKPLEEICILKNSSITTSEIKREKRFLPLVIGGIAIVVALAGLSVGSVALAKSSVNSDEIEKLQQEISSLEAKALSIKKMAIDEFTTMSHFKEGLKNLEKKLNKENINIYAHLNEIQLETYTISTIVSLMQINGFIVKDFIRLWKRGKIYLPMFNILNLLIPKFPKYVKLDPSKLMSLKKCYVDLIKKTITLELMIYNASVNYNILSATPFTLIKNASNEYCLINYVGPRYVLYGNNGTCITRISQQILNMDSNIIFEPSHSQCLKGSETNKESIKYWQKTKCFNKSSLANQDILQIHAVEDGYYIYCFGSKIKIANVETFCPNAVIYLPDSNTIVINGQRIGSQFVNVGTMTEFSSSLNYIANLDFFKNLPEFYNEFTKVDEDLKTLSENKSKIDEEFSNKSLWKAVKESSFWMLIVIIILIAILIIVIILRRRRNSIYVKTKRNKHSNVHGDVEISECD